MPIRLQKSQYAIFYKSYPKPQWRPWICRMRRWKADWVKLDWHLRETFSFTVVFCCKGSFSSFCCIFMVRCFFTCTKKSISVMRIHMSILGSQGDVELPRAKRKNPAPRSEVWKRFAWGGLYLWEKECSVLAVSGLLMLREALHRSTSMVTRQWQIHESQTSSLPIRMSAVWLLAFDFILTCVSPCLGFFYKMLCKRQAS